MKNLTKLLFFSFSLLTGYSISAQSDGCSNAQTITPNLTYCNYQAGSSNGATQTLATCSTGGNADDDVWYEFQANSSEMTIKVDPTVGYDAVIQLFSGSCGSLSSITCQDVNGLNGVEKLEATGLTNGAIYKFRVYHYGIGSGTSTFQVCVSGLAPPTNNNACNAFTLAAVTPSCNFLTFTNAGSTGSTVGNPTIYSCGGSGNQQGGFAGGDVWFEVIVPTSGKLDIHTQSIDFSDGAMALYSGGCSNGTLTQVACDDDSGPGTMPYIYQTGLTAGDIMYIRVWEYNNNNNGEFGICVSTPDNDDCVNAQEICDLNGYGGVTSGAYTVDSPDNMCGIGVYTNPISGCVFGTGYTASTSPVEIDNNSWLKFTASAVVAELFVEILSTQNGNGMQMQIFEGSNCTNFIAVSNFLETATSQTVVASGLTIGNTYYIVIDGFAGDICSYIISATSGVLVPEITTSSKNICLGNSVDLLGEITGTGTYTYNWTDKNGTSLSTSNPLTITPTVSTEYILEVDGLCGATSYSSVYITVNENPTANAGANQTTCDNESVTVNASASGGDENYNFSWNNGTGFGASQTILATSTATYNLLVTDGNGCTDTDLITINVNTSPTANAGNDVTMCLNQTANLVASGGTSYVWSNGPTIAANNVTPTITSTTYSVTVGNSDNCFDTDNVIITVNPLPNAFAGNDIGVCNNGSTNITATGGTSYFWNNGLGTGASQSLTNIISNTTYIVTVTDANNCVATDDVTITVGSALIPDAGQNISICLGESTVLNATGGVNYNWIDGPNESSYSVTPTTTTTYTINVTDGGSCSGSNTVTITVNANPTANAGLDQIICEGETAVLLATGGTTYDWNQTLGTGSSQSVEPTNTTTYEVIVTNSNNCTDTDNIVITVNSNPVVLASQNTTICDGEYTDITASGTGIDSYTWSNSNGGNFNGQNQIVSPTSVTWFYVTGVNSNLCSATDSLLIEVNSNPLIDASSIQLIDASCANGGGTISGITIIGNPDFTYLWTNETGSIGTTVSIGNLESGDYLLTVTDENNCTDTVNVYVGFIDISTVVAKNDSTVTNVNTDVSINVYANDTGDITTINSIDQPSNGYVSYSNDGKYIYTPNPNFIGVDSFTYEICDYSCDNACKIATVTIIVNPLGELIIPNAFSPNNDNFNDLFTITNLDQYENNDIIIFNRWGDKVFEASPYLNDWDGSSAKAKFVVSGNKVVEGTYYFILNLNEKDKEPINGFIDLRRK